MILTVLPKVETHADLFFKYKHEHESLGLASLSLKELDFHSATSNVIENSITGFLTKGIDSNIKEIPIYYDEKKDEYIQYQLMFENYPKLVWLASEYINLKTFKNPIGVHWNVRTNMWNIHPGGSRQVIIYYFEKNSELEVLAFNNGGKSLSFRKKFSSIDEIKEYYKTHNISIVCTADHGSLIPSVHFDQSDMKDNILKSIHQVQQFYKNTKIIANFDISRYGYKENLSRNLETITVTVDNPDDQDNVNRALILLPSFDTFNNYGVRIERT
jgi:hypothetical protein